MVRVFFGTDTMGVRTAALAYTAARAAAGVSIVSIPAEQYSAGQLSDALGATSLFGDVALYVIDTPAEKVEYQTEVLTLLPELAASSNEFVVVEGVLKAAEKKVYVAHAADIQEVKALPTQKINPFVLAEALAQKDKKSLWLLLQSMRVRGSSSEEIIGLLWWQLKALRLAAITQTAAEAGMNEYPYKKAKQALRNFKLGEIEALSSSLLTLYHEGHAGTRELDLALESWVLKV